MSKIKNETLAKKVAIAKRICEPMNDKRIQFVESEDGTSASLSGLEGTKLSVEFHDGSNEKKPKGFYVKNGTKNLLDTDSTLDVGVFLRPIRATLTEIVTPAETEAPAPKAKATKKVAEIAS